MDEYTERDAAAHFAQYLQGVTTDNLLELRYTDQRRVHNLKYYTWVEQQGKTYEEIMAQWYDAGLLA
jgi:cysteine synthase